MKDCVPKYNNLNIFAIYVYLFSLLMDIFYTDNLLCKSPWILAASVTQAEDIFPYMIHQFPCCLPHVSLPGSTLPQSRKLWITYIFYMLHPIPGEAWSCFYAHHILIV